MENTYLQALEEKLKQLDEQREALLKLIAFEGGDVAVNRPSKNITSTSSISGRIVNAVIELIHKNGRQVRTEEILACIEEKKLSLGDTKNKEASLAAILSQEVAKKSARLRRVERGVYDLK
jgi:hypothetical protein